MLRLHRFEPQFVMAGPMAVGHIGTSQDAQCLWHARTVNVRVKDGDPVTLLVQGGTQVHRRACLADASLATEDRHAMLYILQGLGNGTVLRKPLVANLLLAFFELGLAVHMVVSA
jgi:hypothetical protein